MVVLVGAPGAWDEGLVGGPSALFVDGELMVDNMGTPVSDSSQTARFARTTGVCG